MNKLTFNRTAIPLPKTSLITGAYYVGVCRNGSVARWDGKQFHYWRHKLGYEFIETIRHREDDEVFDVFDAWRTVPTYQVRAIEFRNDLVNTDPAPKRSWLEFFQLPKGWLGRYA